MDRLDADHRQLARSLDDLHGVNRWLGGYRSAAEHVLRVAAGVEARPVRVLDVGTGSADVALRLVAEGRRRGISVQIVATDVHPGTLDVARAATAHEPAIEVRHADALRLPFPDVEFDIAFCATTLHHFDPPDAIRVLAELRRVARHAVVVTDLARSRAALLGARVLAATVWRNHPITRHDGPASVRAAYTVEEVRKMALQAFGRDAEVRRQPIFRLALVFLCDGEPSPEER